MYTKKCINTCLCVVWRPFVLVQPKRFYIVFKRTNPSKRHFLYFSFLLNLADKFLRTPLQVYSRSINCLQTEKCQYIRWYVYYMKICSQSGKILLLLHSLYNFFYVVVSEERCLKYCIACRIC